MLVSKPQGFRDRSLPSRGEHSLLVISVRWQVWSHHGHFLSWYLRIRIVQEVDRWVGRGAFGEGISNVREGCQNVLKDSRKICPMEIEVVLDATCRVCRGINKIRVLDPMFKAQRVGLLKRFTNLERKVVI